MAFFMDSSDDEISANFHVDPKVTSNKRKQKTNKHAFFSSDDEVSVNLQLAQKLSINKGKQKLKKCNMNGTEAKPLNNLYRVQDQNSSSSSDTQPGSSNSFGGMLMKKRQNGDIKVEQFGNPKRTCLNDRPQSVNECPSHNGIASDYKSLFQLEPPKFIPEIAQDPHNLSSDDSDFQPRPFSFRNKKKSCNISKSSKKDSHLLKNRYKEQSNGYFVDSTSDDDSRNLMQNGTLKGGRQSPGLLTSKNVAGRMALLSESDSDGDIRQQSYYHPVIFSSSDDEPLACRLTQKPFQQPKEECNTTADVSPPSFTSTLSNLKSENLNIAADGSLDLTQIPLNNSSKTINAENPSGAEAVSPHVNYEASTSNGGPTNTESKVFLSRNILKPQTLRAPKKTVVGATTTTTRNLPKPLLASNPFASMQSNMYKAVHSHLNNDVAVPSEPVSIQANGLHSPKPLKHISKSRRISEGIKNTESIIPEDRGNNVLDSLNRPPVSTLSHENVTASQNQSENPTSMFDPTRNRFLDAFGARFKYCNLDLLDRRGSSTTRPYPPYPMESLSDLVTSSQKSRRHSNVDNSRIQPEESFWSNPGTESHQAARQSNRVTLMEPDTSSASLGDRSHQATRQSSRETFLGPDIYGANISNRSHPAIRQPNRFKFMEPDTSSASPVHLELSSEESRRSTPEEVSGLTRPACLGPIGSRNALSSRPFPIGIPRRENSFIPPCFPMAYPTEVSDRFDADDSEVEFFTANSYSDTSESNAGSLNTTSARTSLMRNLMGTPPADVFQGRLANRNGGSSEDEISVVYTNVPSVNSEPRIPRPRTVGRRGRRANRRRSQRSRSLITESPDPVEQVRQVEEDERIARTLQAQFNAEAELESTFRPPRLPSPDPFLINDLLNPSGITDSDGSTDSSQMGGWRQALPGPLFPVVPHFNISPPVRITSRPNIRRRAPTRRRNDFPMTFIFNHHRLATDDSYEALLSISDMYGDAGRAGLQKSEINRLPTRKFCVNNGPSTSAPLHKRVDLNKECQVCLNDYVAGDELRILTCFHEFHKPCIDPWLQINRTCPVCRVTVDVQG